MWEAGEFYHSARVIGLWNCDTCLIGISTPEYDCSTHTDAGT